jgi:hypothetical protein
MERDPPRQFRHRKTSKNHHQYQFLGPFGVLERKKKPIIRWRIRAILLSRGVVR